MSGGCCLLGNLCLRRYCKARNCQISPRRLLGTPTIKEINNQGLELRNEVVRSQLSQLLHYVILVNRQLCVLHATLRPRNTTGVYFDKLNPIAPDVLQKKTLTQHLTIMTLTTTSPIADWALIKHLLRVPSYRAHALRKQLNCKVGNYY